MNKKRPHNTSKLQQVGASNSRGAQQSDVMKTYMPSEHCCVTMWIRSDCVLSIRGHQSYCGQQVIMTQSNMSSDLVKAIYHLLLKHTAGGCFCIHATCINIVTMTNSALDSTKKSAAHDRVTRGERGGLRWVVDVPSVLDLQNARQSDLAVSHLHTCWTYIRPRRICNKG